MMKYCASCDSENVVSRDIDESYEFKGKTFVIETHVDQCDDCKYYESDKAEGSRVQKIMVNLYRKSEGLLTSDEIKDYRDALGLSQDRFAAYLGVGEASVTRWEGLGIQDKAFDELIRLKCDTAYLRKQMMQLIEQLSRKSESKLFSSLFGSIGSMWKGIEMKSGNFQVDVSITPHFKSDQMKLLPIEIPGSPTENVLPFKRPEKVKESQLPGALHA